jgi:hypothetical protein
VSATYEIDPDHSLLCVEHVGTTDPAQVYETIDRLLADPRVKPGMRVLSDHSRETTISTPKGVVATIPRFVEFMNHLGSFRCAIVAVKTAQIGMAHLAAVYARPRGIDIKVFRDRKRAETWLLGEESE